LHHSLTILGSGFTGKFLLPLAERRYARVFATSRAPERHLSHLSVNQRIAFDLARPDTWASIPTATDVLWCFPAVPIESVRKFAESTLLGARRLIILGSTSAYHDSASTAYPPSWIDESTAIDPTIPRVQGEEFLRTTYGAVVLRVAGIYGPGRNPIDWIRTGRVSRSRKYVNLIHVEDLSAICLAALMHGQSGEVYNVSDGTPRTWNEICEEVERRWNIRSSVSDEPRPSGKRLSNTKMRKLLDVDRTSLCHEDLFEALEAIRNHSLNEAEPSR
jgi:nucleoside-diphosphate-sugar epimerase